MSQTLPEAPRRAPRRSYWAYVPVGMIVAMLVGLGTLARIASNDPSFAVEQDYYQKSVQWDAEMAQQARNRALAWLVELGFEDGNLEVRVRDAQGAAIEGAQVKVEAFHNARAGDILSTELAPRGPGTYNARLPLERAGLWEFRIAVQAGADRFTHTLRRELAP